MQREVIGVPVNSCTLVQAVDTILLSAASARPAMICVADVNSLTMARYSPQHMNAFKSSLMVVADGMPIVMQLRALGEVSAHRVSGTELVHSVCKSDMEKRLRHYFFGGSSAVADAVAKALQREYGIVVAGIEAPPFRPLSMLENEEVLNRMRTCGANLVWVGLGCPKQESWMLENFRSLPATFVGVGAAFDFIAGAKRRAPDWMQKAGLEWAHRLGCEPRRLWRRYAIAAVRFFPLAFAQLISERLVRVAKTRAE